MCNALLLTVLIEPVEKPTMLLYSDHHGVYVYELVSGNASKLRPVKDVLSLDYSFDNSFLCYVLTAPLYRISSHVSKA